MSARYCSFGLIAVLGFAGSARAGDSIDTAQRILKAIQYRAPLVVQSRDDAAARSRIQTSVELENELRALGQRSIPTAAPLTPTIPPVIEEALPRRLVM
jgi:hypothetical protein